MTLRPLIPPTAFFPQTHHSRGRDLSTCWRTPELIRSFSLPPLPIRYNEPVILPREKREGTSSQSSSSFGPTLLYPTDPLLPNLLVLFSARQIRLPWQRAPSERKKRTEMVPRVWLTCMRLDRDDSLGCTDEPKEKKGQNL